MEKALHEAKVHSTWINPNHGYDDAVRQFVEKVLDPVGNAEFFTDFLGFQRRIHAYGIWNSLGQTLLKIAAPGVPDIYQGTEFWELSLVDPDNRRPVDFALRGKTLADLRERGVSTTVTRQLLDQRDDGRIKMYLLWRGLTLRRERAALFADGAYLPLDVVGPAKDHVVAFARIHGDQAAIAVVPRLLVGLFAADQTPSEPGIWSDTRIVLGELPTRRFRHAFTGAEISVDTSGGRRELGVETLLRDFPVALLGST